MSPTDKARDEDRDAWLAQALRHAPDANADAPPALSDAILREARAAAPRAAASHARPRPGTTSPLQWLASAWSWLARPPVAAGFASVMVASLVGVMWWGQPLDQTLPRAPEGVSSTPQARAEASPPAAVAAAPAAPKAAEPSRESAAQGRLANKKEAETNARASRPTGERVRMLGAADAGPVVAAAPPAAFPAAPAAPAPQAAAAANEAQSAHSERLEQAAPAAKAMAKARSTGASEAPLATLRAQIAQQPERWLWQRAPGTPQPMNPAMQRWLAELDRQTASRWQSNAGSMVREPSSSVRLFRDGALQLTLGLTGSGVWAEAIGASALPALMVPLPESTAESLRKALDDAAP